jgi:ribosomal protein L11 methylase PrmA
MAPEKKNLILAFIAIVISSGLTLVGPFLVGHAIDTYIVTGDYHGVLVFSGILRSQEKAVSAGLRAAQFEVMQMVRRGKWVAGLARALR